MKGTSGFMKYVYYRAKSRYGKDYRNVIVEAIFKFQCYKLRGKPRKFADVLIECGVLTEDEVKTSQIKSTFQKAKEEKTKQEKIQSEEDKAYKQYKHLVQYFIHYYSTGRLPFSPATDHEDIFHDCWYTILQHIDFKNFEHKAITSYIAKIVRTQCLRSCAKMMHIKIPFHIFHALRYANRWPKYEGSWEILSEPRNRFVMPLEDGDIAIPDEEKFKYEHLEEALIGMFNRLSTQEKFILSSRFGPEKKTLEEIGEILHYTRERIRQLEEALIRRLRHQMLSTKEITKEEYTQLSALPEEGKFEKAHAPPQSQPRCRDTPPPDISQSQPVCRDKKTPEFCHSAINAIQIKIASAR